MAEDRDGSSGPQEGSARAKRRTVKPEDVRIVYDNSGQGVEGMALGPAATDFYRKQLQRRQKPNAKE